MPSRLRPGSPIGRSQEPSSANVPPWMPRSCSSDPVVSDAVGKREREPLGGQLPGRYQAPTASSCTLPYPDVAIGLSTLTRN